MRLRIIKHILLLLVLALGGALALSLLAKQRDRADRFAYRLPVNHSSMSVQSALDLVTQRLAAQPDSFMDLNTLADLRMSLARRTGDPAQFDLAAAAARKSLLAMPTRNSGAEVVLARILENQHQFSEAIAAARAMLATNANASGPYNILITSSLAIGDLGTAMMYADDLVARSPRVGSLALRGLVYINAGREEEGIFDLEHGIHLEDLGEEGDSTWARCMLARHLLARGELGDAKYLLDEALRISPGFPLALDLKAQVLSNEGRASEAMPLFEQAFTESRQIVYLRHAADLNQMLKQNQLATDRWTQTEKLLRADLNQGLYGHRLELAKLLYRRAQGNDLREAAELVGHEIKIRRGADVFYLAAAIHFALNEIPLATQAISEALRSGVREAKYYDLASQIFRAGPRAEIYRQLARERDPSFATRFIFL